jgi:hypothetical protein
MTRRNHTKVRLFLTLAVLAAGVLLLLYGALFGRRLIAKGPVGELPPIPISDAGQRDDVLSVSEFKLVKEVTVGGVIRWENGVIQKTYDEKAQPASLCPT